MEDEEKRTEKGGETKERKIKIEEEEQITEIKEKIKR